MCGSDKQPSCYITIILAHDRRKIMRAAVNSLLTRAETAAATCFSALTFSVVCVGNEKAEFARASPSSGSSAPKRALMMNSPSSSGLTNSTTKCSRRSRCRVGIVLIRAISSSSIGHHALREMSKRQSRASSRSVDAKVVAVPTCRWVVT